MPNTLAPELTLSQAAAWVGGALHGQDVAFLGATQDSRKIKAGQLFVALKGTQADGHEYLPMAIDAGAAAALVNRVVEADIPQLVVDDVEQALQQIAREWRKTLDAKVVGITGSCGKTTVKQMLAAICAEQGATLATEGNLNNQLGVPMTLLGLTSQHDFAVVEMGASGAGDIELLCDIAQPDVGVITMIAEAHLEGFGSLQGTAQAKGEMYQGLKANGIAVMNADEPWAELWTQQSSADLNLRFGSQALADVSVSQKHCRAWLDGNAAGSRFSLNLPSQSLDVSLPLPGWHNVMNACAAAATAVALSIPAEAIVKGLEQAENVSGRLAIHRLDNDCLLIDDSYNANPASIEAAAAWLADVDVAGNRILVLGEMAEMGEASVDIHRRLGKSLASFGIQQLWSCGGAAALAIAEGFGSDGYHYADQTSLISILGAALSSGDAVLVKGSRSAAMENVVNGLSAMVAGRAVGA